MTIALHDLADARTILDEWLEESEGEVTTPIAELWDKLEGQISDKIERWSLWIIDRVAEAKAIKEEEERLRARRKVLENAVERSKAELLRQMQLLGKTKVNGLLCSASVCQNSAPSVTTPLQPSELWATDGGRPFVKREEVVQYAIDRDAILAAWKNNQALPASIVVDRGFHLRLK